MASAQPVHLIFFTIIAVLFIVFGFTHDGYLAQASILFGGLYLGNVVTEALNYDEAQAKEGE